MLAIAAAVQRIAGRIEAEDDLVFRHAQVQADVGGAGIDAGPLAGAGPKLVHDGILGELSHEERMLKCGAVHHGRYGEGLVRTDEILPIDAADFAVQRLFIGSIKSGERTQQAHGKPAPESHFVEQALVTNELDGPRANMGDIGSEVVQLVGEQFFQTKLGGGGEVHNTAKVGRNCSACFSLRHQTRHYPNGRTLKHALRSYGSRSFLIRCCHRRPGPLLCWPHGADDHSVLPVRSRH